MLRFAFFSGASHKKCHLCGRRAFQNKRVRLDFSSLLLFPGKWGPQLRRIIPRIPAHPPNIHDTHPPNFMHVTNRVFFNSPLRAHGANQLDNEQHANDTPLTRVRGTKNTDARAQNRKAGPSSEAFESCIKPPKPEARNRTARNPRKKTNKISYSRLPHMGFIIFCAGSYGRSRFNISHCEGNIWYISLGYYINWAREIHQLRWYTGGETSFPMRTNIRCLTTHYTSCRSFHDLARLPVWMFRDTQWEKYRYPASIGKYLVPRSEIHSLSGRRGRTNTHRWQRFIPNRGAEAWKSQGASTYIEN